MGAGPAPGHTLGASCGRRRIKLLSRDALSERDTGMNTPTADRSRNTPELELSPMSRKVKHFDKYSRKGGRWSWKRPSYERDVVSLVKAERRIEEGIASALTEVEAVEAGLRYFDEIIMPESQKIPSRKKTEVAAGSTSFRPQVPFSEKKAKLDRADGRLEAGPRGRQEGGFSKSQEEKVRDFVAARKSDVGRGSLVMSSCDRAVAECTDLKLTLKQRLDNYDRQRGINTDTFSSDSPTRERPVPVIEGEGKGHDGMHHTDGSNNARGSRVPIAVGGSQKGREVNALAPYCDAGVVGAGGVGRILSRSLGMAAALVRRNKPTDGDSGSIGSSQHNGGSAARSRWKSWNEGSPPALLGAGGVRNLSATRNGNGRNRKHTSATGAIIGVVPPASSRRRAEGVNNISSSTSSSTSALAGKNRSAEETSATSVSSARRFSVDSDKPTGASAGEVPPSAASSSSSRRSSGASGPPLVPRVAMLAGACATRNHEAEAARKGKEFDPDQLECVRRHLASMADRERRVRSMRSEAEKKMLFRARPLPAYLDGTDVATDSDRGFLSSRGGSGTRRKRDGAGREQSPSVGTGLAGSSPVLLEALEQDEEARVLVEKIRKINPRVDIASIVLQSTPLPLQPTTRKSDDNCSVPPRPSSRGATAAGTSAVVASASLARSMSDDATPSLSVSTTASGPQRTVDPGKQQSLPSSIDPDWAISSAVTKRSLREEIASGAEAAAPRSAAQEEAEGGDYLLPVDERDDGPESQTGGEVSRQEDQGGFDTAAAQEGEGGRGSRDGGIDQGAGGTRRRSLMGRMLESGMLERQKEWAKARRKKVLESRRQVEEAKEQEGKGDVMDAGLSSRSWSKAKTQHLRSLERQRQDEEERETIREARRRASAFRAERELESAERRAAEIAKNLADAENARGAMTGIRVGRGGRAARSSRGGGGEPRSRRSPPPPPRGATAHVGNGGSTIDAGGSGSTDLVARGDPRRRSERDDPCRRENDNENDPAEAVEADVHLSEDSFYRVAVEKIMEKEKLGIGEISGGGGGDDSIGEDGVRRSRGYGSRHGRAWAGAAGNPSMLASPNGVAVGRRSRRKAAVAPRHRKNRDGSNANILAHTALAGSRRPSGGYPTKRQSYAAPAAPETNFYKGRSVVPPGLSPTKGVARTSSLLSLYEAQSVEYPNGHSGRVHLDNSGPYLDDAYAHAPLDVGQSVFEPGAQAVTETDWPDQGVRRLANSAGRDSRTAGASAAAAAGSAPAEAADDTRRGRHLPDGTDEIDYPWSDERRAPRSIGSGAGVRRDTTGDDRIDVGSATVDKGTRWDNFQDRRALHGRENDKEAGRGEESARRRGWATGLSATVSELSPQAVTPTGISRQHGDSGFVLPQFSPRKRGPLDRRRTDGFVSSATASPRGAASLASRDWTSENRSAGQEQLQAPYGPAPQHGLDSCSGGLDGALSGAGLGVDGRFSLWSSSDEDATITEINCHDEGDGERSHGSDGEFLVRAAAGGLGGNGYVVQHSSRADDESDHFQTPERRALLSIAPSVGEFFDAATSSADKGRFKVRDPRLFDPCSMCRRPDAVVEPVRSMALADGAEYSKPTAFRRDGGKSSSVGVTLLLGCRADQRDADDAQEQQQPVDGGEQVITVMFDRSKFNEEEAERWWRAHRVRIEGIGAPLPEAGSVCKPSRGV